VPNNGWEKAFRRPWPARASTTARAASSKCWLIYGLCAAGAFQRRKVDLLLSLAASAAAAARARRRRLPRPRRAQQAVRSGLLCCGIIGSRPLTPWPSVVAGAQDEGKGGEARAAPSSRSPAASWATPDARSPPLAARSRPVEPAAARRNCLFAPLHDSLCGCCCLQGKGRRRRERAGSSCTRLRHEKDDDKEDKKKMETVLISTI